MRWWDISVSIVAGAMITLLVVLAVVLAVALVFFIQIQRCGGFGSGRSPEPSAYAQYAPQLSPDGELIFIEWDGAIYAVTASGDDMWTIPRKRPLLKRWFRDDPPRYSPTVSSSGLLAYLEKGGCASLTVKTSDLTGQEVSTIQRDVSRLRPNVAWSADGEWLAFGAPEDRDDSDERIIVRHRDRNETRELVLSGRSWGDSSIQGISWSPGGHLAVVWRDNWNLSVGTLDGGFEFVEGGPDTPKARVYSPTWSPDGRHLYYALLYRSRRPPEANLDIIQLNPITLDKRIFLSTRITNDPPRSLQFGPDGQLFIMLSGPGDVLYAIGRNSLNLHDILPPISAEAWRTYSATRQGALDASWSPDGSLIAVRNSDPTADIVLYTVRPDGSHMRALLRRGDDLALLPAN